MTTENVQRRLTSSIVTLDRLRHVLIYDKSTGYFYWNATDKIAGTVGEDGYVKIQVDGIRYGGHTLAWYYVHGEFCLTDHKDRIRFHNWIDNLRKSTYQLNAANRASIGTNSGFKGVYQRGNGKFETGIKIDQVRYYLGTYDTAEEAYAVYMKAALEHFGEFAHG